MIRDIKISFFIPTKHSKWTTPALIVLKYDNAERLYGYDYGTRYFTVLTSSLPKINHLHFKYRNVKFFINYISMVWSILNYE